MAQQSNASLLVSYSALSALESKQQTLTLTNVTDLAIGGDYLFPDADNPGKAVDAGAGASPYVFELAGQQLSVYKAKTVAADSLDRQSPDFVEPIGVKQGNALLSVSLLGSDWTLQAGGQSDTLLAASADAKLSLTNAGGILIENSGSAVGFEGLKFNATNGSLSLSALSNGVDLSLPTNTLTYGSSSARKTLNVDGVSAVTLTQHDDRVVTSAGAGSILIDGGEGRDQLSAASLSSWTLTHSLNQGAVVIDASRPRLRISNLCEAVMPVIQSTSQA